MMRRYVLIIIALLTLLCGSLAADPFLTIDSIDSGTDFPLITSSVSLNTRFMKHTGNLSEEHFSLYEDGYRVSFRIAPLQYHNDYMHIVFSFDTSRSIEDKAFTSLKKSAGELINRTSRDDQVALYLFNDQVTLKSNFSTDRDILGNTLKNAVRSGKKTLLYDSLYDALSLLTEVKGMNRRLVCFTDGRDQGSSVKQDDIISFSRKHNVPVFFFYSNIDNLPSGIKRIAKLTGGKVFADSEDVDITSRSILTSTYRKYKIQYRSMIKPDGKDHALEIRFKHGEIRDRALLHFQVPLSRQIQSYFAEHMFLIITGLFLIVFLVIVILLVNRDRFTIRELKERDKTISRLSELMEQTVLTSRETNSDTQDDASMADIQDQGEITEPGAFLVKKLQGGGNEKIIISGFEIILGSDSSCSVVIPGDDVSSQHAKIKFIGDSFYIMDMISEQGTFLNDKKVLRPRKLYDWDEIRIGTAQFIFRNRFNISR